MSMMMQDNSRKPFTSSWENISFSELLKIAFLPSLAAAVIVGSISYWKLTALNPWPFAVYLAAAVFLYGLILFGLAFFYFKRYDLEKIQMMVIMCFSGLFIGLLVAIFKTVLVFYPLALFRIISEPTIVAFGAGLVGLIGFNFFRRLSQK